MSRPRSLMARGPFMSPACMRPGSFSSDSSSETIRRPDDEPTDDVTHKRRTLPALSLPFDSRLRESHLVTDEEFDEIARNALQDELTDGQRPMRMRRSMSTNRNSWFSNFAPRTRPASYAAGPSHVEPVYKLRKALEDWQKELNAHQGEPGWPAHPQGTIVHEPSSFTALPDPPTRNNLAEYPSDDVPPARPVSAHDEPTVQSRRSVSILTQPEAADAATTPYHTRPKHQRAFSVQAISANVVQTFKKHVFNRRPSPLADDVAESRSDGEPVDETEHRPHTATSTREAFTDGAQSHQTEAYNLQPSDGANSTPRLFVQAKRRTRKWTGSSSMTTPSLVSTWATTTAATTPLVTVADPVLGFTPHPTSNAAAYQASHGVFSPCELPSYTKEQLHIIIVQQRAYMSNLEVQNKCAIEQISNSQDIITKLGNERTELRNEAHEKDMHISELLVKVSELEATIRKS